MTSYVRPKPPFLLVLILISIFQLSLTQNLECSIIQVDQGHTTDTCPKLHSCIDNVCVHKDIFPLTTNEIIGSILIMLLAGLTNSGGLGGGSLLSPLLLIFFKYDTTKTISIVYILIFGGSLGNYLNVFKHRDPKTTKPIVIYDLALLVMPLMIIGTHLGVVINQVLAPIITIICLTVVIYSMLKKIYAKAKTTYAKESRKRSIPLLDPDRKPSIESNWHSRIDVELTEMDRNRPTLTLTSLDEEVEDLMEEDYKLFPKRKMSLLLGLLFFTATMAYLRGTDELDSVIGIDHCTPAYWGFFALALLGCFFFFLYDKRFVSNRLALKREKNALFQEQSYQLNGEKDMHRLGILGAGAGFLAGLLGIGGGIILGPTLMNMGVEAQSLAATVGFFVVQTSFISLFQSFLYGNVSTNELLYFFSISVIGSYFVSYAITMLVNKYKRPSILLFLLSGVLLASMIAMPTFTLWKTYKHPGEMFTFRPLC